MKPLSVLRLGLPPQIDPAWDQAIQEAAGGDPSFDALIRGVISQESEWRANAYRAEPRINDASRGLMQVLLGTARMIQPGISGDELMDPVTNISIGSAYLGTLRSQYASDADVVSAYNHGTSWTAPGGGHHNQAYVDAVLGNAAWYAAQLSPPTSNGATNNAAADPGLTSGVDLSLLVPLGLVAGALIWSRR